MKKLNTITNMLPELGDLNRNERLNGTASLLEVEYCEYQEKNMRNLQVGETSSCWAEQDQQKQCTSINIIFTCCETLHTKCIHKDHNDPKRELVITYIPKIAR
jgi:hypothetical protein